MDLNIAQASQHVESVKRFKIMTVKNASTPVETVGVNMQRMIGVNALLFKNIRIN